MTVDRKRIWGWGAAEAVIVVAALVPVLWLLSLSLKDPASVNDGRLIPKVFSLDSYSSIFKEDIFTKALRNSIGIALISTVIAVILASMAAYAIARLEFPGKRLLLAASLAIAMFPPVSIVGPLYDMWRTLGLYDTWPGLIIPYMTFTLPLAIFTLSAFFREIPWELEQAAQMDGATPAQAFRKVILPLAAPAVMANALYVFMIAWNEFLFALLFLVEDRNDWTVSLGLAQLSGGIEVSKTVLMAGSVVLTLPIVVLFFAAERLLTEGLTAGADKG
jgi:trehalose/maltose transport system permease protein